MRIIDKNISLSELVKNLDSTNETISSIEKIGRNGQLNINQQQTLAEAKKFRKKVLQKIHKFTNQSLNTLRLSSPERNIRCNLLFGGSFDPPTDGHISVVTSVLDIHQNDNLVIGIATNDQKNPKFSPYDRKFLIERSIPQEYKSRVKVDIVEGIMKIYATKNGIPISIRSTRNSGDIEYENNLAKLNEMIPGKMYTSISPQTDASKTMISSSNFKLMSNLGISLESFGPAFTREALKMKMYNKLLIGVTGGSGCGKSTICKRLSEYSKNQDVKIHYLDMDRLGHIILNETKDVCQMYIDTRDIIEKEFGSSVRRPDGTINRQVLGKMVFNDKKKLDKLNKIMEDPIMTLFTEEMSKIKEGIVLVESALLIEHGITDLTDENIINVTVSPEIQKQRMLKRKGMTPAKIEDRLNALLTGDKIRDKIKDKQQKEFDRFYLEINTDDGIEKLDEQKLYNTLEKRYFLCKEVRRYGNLYIPSEISFNDDEAFIKTVVEKHSESHRKYHNLKHIEEMLYLLQKVRIEYKKMYGQDLPHFNEIYLAIMFHDIVYDIKKKYATSNEQKSADFAREYLTQHLKSTGIDIDIVCELVLLTESHTDPSHNAEHLEEFKKIFLDLDMTIFAANEDRVEEYETGISDEYTPIYSKAEYLEGRRRTLWLMVDKRVIYHSQLFRKNFDKKAWENIKKLLEITIREQTKQQLELK